VKEVLVSNNKGYEAESNALKHKHITISFAANNTISIGYRKNKMCLVNERSM